MKNNLILIVTAVLFLLIISCSKNNNVADNIAIISFDPARGTQGNTVTVTGKGFGNTIGALKLFFTTSFLPVHN